MKHALFAYFASVDYLCFFYFFPLYYCKILLQILLHLWLWSETPDDLRLLSIQKAFLHLLSFSLRLSKDCELSTCLCLGKGYVIKYSYQIPL